MRTTRRHLLGMGGGLVAALVLPLPTARADGMIEIEMSGRRNGARVWFDPIGIRVDPGQTLRWTNRDERNAHTATAYHPANFDRPRRIPQAAEPWDSDFLLPGDSFSVTFVKPGVYDYYCVPHEHAGMVGRIIVGAPERRGSSGGDGSGDGLPEVALNAFPSIHEIMEKGIVRRA